MRGTPTKAPNRTEISELRSKCIGFDLSSDRLVHSYPGSPFTSFFASRAINYSVIWLRKSPEASAPWTIPRRIGAQEAAQALGRSRASGSSGKIPDGNLTAKLTPLQCPVKSLEYSTSKNHRERHGTQGKATPWGASRERGMRISPGGD